MKPVSWLPAVFLLTVPSYAAGQDTNVLAMFDVGRDGDALVIPGTVNGKVVLFLLDTGSSHNALDKARLPAEPKETTTLLVSNGKVVRHLYALPQAQVAGQVLQESDRILGADLRGLRDATGYQIYGTLGMDFLHQHVIQIDFDRGKLAFLKSVPADSGIGMCLTFAKGGVPFVTAKVSGSAEDVFLVNTGLLSTFSGSLNQDRFRRLEEIGSLKVVDRISSMTKAGRVQVRMGEVGPFSVGSLPVANLVFGESGVSMLGLGYLSRFQVVFDFPNGLMYLKKGGRFEERDVFGSSNIHLVRKGGKTVIESISGDRVTVMSGLRAGDIVLRVAGKSANEASLFHLRRLLRPGGTEVGVTVQRGDRRIDTTLVPTGR